MSDRLLTCYGIDASLKTVEFGLVGAEAAVAICMERIPRGFERFQDERASLPATMFGFSASRTLFIEFLRERAGRCFLPV